MRQTLYEALDLVLRGRSTSQLFQMTFLFIIGMTASLLYAERLPYGQQSVICFLVSLFCAGGAAVTCLYGNFVGNEGLWTSMGMASIFMSTFVQIGGAFSALQLKSYLSPLWTVLAKEGWPFVCFILFVCWDIFRRQVEERWQMTHSTKSKWCRVFWKCVGVFVLDLVLHACTGISIVNSILKFFYVHMIF